MESYLDNFSNLRDELRQFNLARDWHQFHSPKNLAIALVVEAGELAEHFRWLTEKQSWNLDESGRMMVGDEIADVLIFLTILADKMNINMGCAVERKLGINKKRYPVEHFCGSAEKYNHKEQHSG